MDTFIDKLAQKRNAQEMILANMTAEAAKMEEMQNQMKAYDDLMQEIRQMNLKTAVNLANVQSTLQEYMTKLETLQQDNSRDEETQRALLQIRELLEGNGKDEETQRALLQIRELLEGNGKDEETQRALLQIRELLEDNSKGEETQRALLQIRELLEDNSKDEETQRALLQIRELLEDNGKDEETKQTLAQLREVLDEKFRQADDFLHKENVKVYRNVQASVIEELNKQTEELRKSHKDNRGSKAVLPISILILLAVLADIVIHLLGITIPM